MLLRYVITAKRALFGGGALVLLITAVALFFFLQKDDKGIAVKIAAGKADLEVQNFHYTEVGDPESRWEVNADKAQYEREDEEVILTQVRIRLLSSKDKVYTMSADRGILHRDSGNMELYGHVVAVSGNGERVETDMLKYDASKKTIHTDEKVIMYNKNIQLAGKGLIYFLKEEKLILSSHVKAIINEGA